MKEIAKLNTPLQDSPLAAEKRRCAPPAPLALYFVGFALSLLLTLLAYFVVINKIVSGWGLVAVILGLGVLQAVVQLLFFLHLGAESRPRWHLYALLFMLLVLIMLVAGSIWVMADLDYRMMPPM